LVTAQAQKTSPSMPLNLCSEKFRGDKEEQRMSYHYLLPLNFNLKVEKL
jgi:hypothetical protein